MHLPDASMPHQTAKGVAAASNLGILAGTGPVMGGQIF
jgi:hypothetical protein